MPSDKYDSITAEVMGLVLFTARRRFSKTGALWYTAVHAMHALIFVLLCVPFLFKVSICSGELWLLFTSYHKHHL